MSDTEIKNGIAERSAEIALNTIDTLKKELEDKDVRLDEAFAMIEDKDKEIERQRLTMGELELKIADLHKKPSEQITKLETELELRSQEIRELREIDAKHVRENDFQPASKVISPTTVWVAACNALYLFNGLRDGSKWAIEHNDPWKKVVFDVADNGQLKNARLEGT